MNVQEYAALLDDVELSPAMRTVYLVFRRFMDYETGIVGHKRVVDYRELSQSLEYIPPRGSRDKALRYSRDQIKRLIQGLVDRGYLVRLHSSGLREKMVFKLPLAVCDLNRPNEERHQSATRTPPPKKSDSMRVVGSNYATRAPRDERHISDISDISLSSHSTREKFSMQSDWSPEDEEWVADYLLSFGINVREVDEWRKGAVLDQFVRYWIDERPEACYTQSTWESKFCESALTVLRGRVN